jgi:exosortase/archaeosortase family protein
LKVDLRYRLALWLGAAAILCQAVYPQQVSTLISSVDEISAGNLGDVYPLAAVLFVGVFVLLRWRDFRGLLLEEGGPRTRPLVRLAGLLLCLSPLMFLSVLAGHENYLSVAVLPVFLVFWGVSLLINPSTLKLSIPYSAAILAATLLPDPLTVLVGAPLADIASLLSRLFLSATGVHYTYSSLGGPQLQLFSQAEGSLAIDITTACSSLSSISVFLLLVVLMHMDLGKDRSSTIKIAIFGTVALVLLNGLRVAALVWAWLIGGSSLLAGVHELVGYVIFVAFYCATAFAYIKIGRHPRVLV